MFSDPKHNIEQFMLGEGMRVADFGVGSGQYAIEAAKVVREGGRVYALDIQKDLLIRVKKMAQDQGLNNVEIVWADLEKPGSSKLRDLVADAAIVSNVLFQIEDKDSFLDEVVRVIRPGGKVLVVDWSDSFGGLGPQPEHIVKESEVENGFREKGFTVEKRIYAGEHHFGIIFRKR